MIYPQTRRLLGVTSPVRNEIHPTHDSTRSRLPPDLVSTLDNIIAPHADEAMTAMDLASQGLEVTALQALVSPFPGKELIAALGQAVKVWRSFWQLASHVI